MNNAGYFSIIPARVRYDKSVTANAKLMYAEITALANKHGYCFASNQYFMDLYDASEASVRRWLKSLEEAGHIKRDVAKKRSGTDRKIYLAEAIPQIQGNKNQHQSKMSGAKKHPTPVKNDQSALVKNERCALVKNEPHISIDKDSNIRIEREQPNPKQNPSSSFEFPLPEKEKSSAKKEKTEPPRAEGEAIEEARALLVEKVLKPSQQSEVWRMKHSQANFQKEAHKFFDWLVSAKWEGMSEQDILSKVEKNGAHHWQSFFSRSWVGKPWFGREEES